MNAKNAAATSDWSGIRPGIRMASIAASTLLVSWALTGCGGGGGGDSASNNSRGAPTYALSGTVTGLEEGALTIRNGADTVTVKASTDAQGVARDLPFSFNLPAGATYTIAINDILSVSGLQCGLDKEQNPAQVSGIMPAGPRSGVTVACTRVKSLRLLAGQLRSLAERDGLASQVAFDYLNGLARDKKDNIYVIDGKTIRRITAAGAVSTIAGAVGENGSSDGSGATARFNWPTSIVVDANDTIYVADSGAKAIRRIVQSGSEFSVSTVASLTEGTGSPSPVGGQLNLGMASTGLLYVADSERRSIRVVDPGKGFAVSTLVSGDAMTQPPNGIAVDLAGKVHVATDEGIYLVTAEGVSKGPSTPARRIAIGKDGNVYVTNGLAVQQVDANGVASTVAGAVDQPGYVNGSGNAARFSYLTGLAFDSSGNLIVTDANTVRRITKQGGEFVVSTMAGVVTDTQGSTDGVGSTAKFSNPSGVAVDANGHLYVADASNHTVRHITPEGEVTTVAGKAGESGTADGDRATARFHSPRKIAVDAAGTVYVHELEVNKTGMSQRKKIRRVTKDGVVSTLVDSARNLKDGNGAAVNVSFQAFAVDTTGDLYVTVSNSVRRITKNVATDEMVMSVVAVIDEVNPGLVPFGLSSVAVDAQGALYVAESTTHTVYRIAKAAAGTEWEVKTIAGSVGMPGSADGIGAAARFHSPSDIAVDAAGNLYVADSGNQTIRFLVRNADGTYSVSTLAGRVGDNSIEPGPLPRSIGSPANLAVTPKRIYFTGAYDPQRNTVLFMDR